MSPILKINLDELDKSKLNQLAEFMFGIGKNKEAHKIERYIKLHNL